MFELLPQKPAEEVDDSAATTSSHDSVAHGMPVLLWLVLSGASAGKKHAAVPHCTQGAPKQGLRPLYACGESECPCTTLSPRSSLAAGPNVLLLPTVPALDPPKAAVSGQCRVEW